MTIYELHKELSEIIIAGFGDIEIHLENGDMDYEIDSIQKDTMPSVKPNYYFFESGGEVKE